MLARLEPVTTLPGLVRRANTYALALDADALYVILLGPAMAPQHYRGARYASFGEGATGVVGSAIGRAVAQPLIARIEERFGQRVSAGLARLAERGHEALSAEKGSYRFSREQVRAFAPGRGTAVLKTDARRFRFHVLPSGEAEFEAFARAVRTWAGLG